MGNFKIGDKVIALTNPPLNEFVQERIKGHIYTVIDIRYCCKCGVQCINIGPKAVITIAECYCGCLYQTEGLKWTDSKFFVKVDEDSIEEELEIAIKNEDYELASIFRDCKII